MRWRSPSLLLFGLAQVYVPRDVGAADGDLGTPTVGSDQSAPVVARVRTPVEYGGAANGDEPSE